MSDLGFDSAVHTGRIRVQRARMFGDGSGLGIPSNDNDLRIENDRFECSSTDGGNILNGAGLAIRHFARAADVPRTCNTRSVLSAIRSEAARPQR